MLTNEKAVVVSALHVAAVNGDKASLAKYLRSATATGLGPTPTELNAADKLGRTPLTYAVLADRPECVDLLIRAGADAHAADTSGNTALHLAAKKGHFQCAKLLLSRGVTWKTVDQCGMTALHMATHPQSPRCLALLLKQIGAGEVDLQDSYKRTALHWSASFGHTHHLRILIKHNANIGIPDVDGKTPLHWAASCSNETAAQCVKILMETAPSVINWQDYFGRTALHLAVADSNKAVVETLTSVEKCNINPMDNMFRTPLHWAAVLGLAEIVGLLLDRQAEYSSSDTNGATPLHYAAQKNHYNVVEAFLSHPEVVDEPDLDGRTAIMWAAGKGADQVIQVMHKYGTDLTSRDKNGATALHAAAMSGSATTVRMLLEMGAPPMTMDNQQHPPLFYACEMGHAAVAQALLEPDSTDPSPDSHVDEDGKSALHWAAIGGHSLVCQLIIRHGLDPNCRDLFGRTPLQCAAFGGHVDCISTLLENGAHHAIQDNEGMMAIHWACSRGHLDAVQLLVAYNSYLNAIALTDDSYTPLDLALLGGHQETVQYLINCGGMSVNSIHEVAATKIQAFYRGYRVRKCFREHRSLLIRHERLKRDARWRAETRMKFHESADSSTKSFNLDANDCLNKFSSISFQAEDYEDLGIHDVPSDGESLNDSEDDECKDLASDYKFVMSGSRESESDSDSKSESFKHLDVRGIKLNRKRFPILPVRPCSNSELACFLPVESQFPVIPGSATEGVRASSSSRRPATEKTSRKTVIWNSTGTKADDDCVKLSKDIPKHFSELNLTVDGDSDIAKLLGQYNYERGATAAFKETSYIGTEPKIALRNKETNSFKERPRNTVQLVKSTCFETVIADPSTFLKLQDKPIKDQCVEVKPRLNILKTLRQKISWQRDSEDVRSPTTLRKDKCLNDAAPEKLPPRTHQRIDGECHVVDLFTGDGEITTTSVRTDSYQLPAAQPAILDVNAFAKLVHGPFTGRNCLSASKAAAIIQRAWKCFLYRKRSFHGGKNVHVKEKIEKSDARMAAEEAWNDCLVTIALQKASISASQVTPVFGNGEANPHPKGKENKLNLVRTSAHYSYNLRTIGNLKTSASKS